ALRCVAKRVGRGFQPRLGDPERVALRAGKGLAMIISKKAIPRRTVLRGMGSMLALPLLDSMMQALSAMQKTAARPVNRFGVMFVTTGLIMKHYLTLTDGADS